MMLRDTLNLLIMCLILCKCGFVTILLVDSFKRNASLQTCYACQKHTMLPIVPSIGRVIPDPRLIYTQVICNIIRLLIHDKPLSFAQIIQYYNILFFIKVRIHCNMKFL